MEDHHALDGAAFGAPGPLPLPLKRYNLVVPAMLFAELQAVADQRGVTVLSLLRRFIKLGLIIAQAEDDPDTVLVLKSGTQERQLLLL